MFCFNFFWNRLGVTSIITSIIALIAGLIVSGYSLAIVRDTIHGYDQLPSFDIVGNIVDGIKVLILGIVYSIIPFIVFFVLLIVTGAAGAFVQVIDLTMGGATTVPSDLALSFVGSLGITFIISLIVFIIFSLFSTIAMCRLANTGSFSQGFAFSEIIGDFKRIGVGLFISWWIVLAIISIILILISEFISAVPYIGYVVSILFIYSFITIFASRATGLIYSN
ncbi:MAG: DUF4013 domain-containing protein [Methanobrevibacter woesei]|nr:DUF4013 domain-containing protein [Methanobrevibacter woesei]